MRLFEVYNNSCRRIWIVVQQPSPKSCQAALILVGLAVILAGLENESVAQAAGDDRFMGGHRTVFNDDRLADAINAILTYLEGTFGAMVMVAAGIGAILSAAFGQYRAALGLLVVAVGAFILRSLIGTFFNDVNIQP